MRIFGGRIIAQAGFILLLSLSLTIASAEAREYAQQPLSSHHQDAGEAALSGKSWNLNFISPALHYFLPNGQSIVPCELPPLPQLPPLPKMHYGRRDDDVPPSPE